ncbi:MAG TPA: adenylate/guanylate cyclase domain-containing protein [Actinomycetota bacterium]|jgi:class 3 adenylate cyclase|nr:adenylate/guanylate cyclase domain-containing protein [Actinomycetota bacterium]
MSSILEESPLQAGRDAAARHAWREAYDLLQQADGEDSLTAPDLEQLAESAWWLGRLDDAIDARQRAYAAYLDAGERRRAAVVALAVAQDYFGKRAHAVGAGWFSRAERILKEEGDCAERGHLEVMYALSAAEMGDHEGTLAAARRTLDIGTRFGDRDLQAFGVLLEGKALVALGKVEEGLALLDEATVAAVSGEIGPFASGIIYCVAISSTARLADYQRAGEWTEASRRWCERQSISGFPGVCRVHRAEIMRLRGSWSEAESEARRALTELQNFNLEFAAEGFYEIGEIRLRMGDLDEARDAFRQAHELGRDPQPGLALLHLAEGKTDAALSSLRRALDDEAIDKLGRCRLLTPLVTVALAHGDVELAKSSAAEAGAIAEEFGSGPLIAFAKLADAEVLLAEGESRRAVQVARDAWRLYKSADLPYEAARARMTLGVALRADGDEEGAVLELQAARATFEKLGAVLDLRRALDLLGDDVHEGLPKSGAPAARVTKTFMFTDIVNSTNLVEVLGDAAWEDLLAWHDQTMRRVFAEHHGEEVKQVGDGFFVAFDDPSDAVECAVEIQRHLAEHRREAGFAPQVRIGLHSAAATQKAGDYAGKGVHEAARIGALATAGEVVVSQDVLDAATVRFPLSEPREVRLKGVKDPVTVRSVEVPTG